MKHGKSLFADSPPGRSCRSGADDIEPDQAKDSSTPEILPEIHEQLTRETTAEPPCTTDAVKPSIRLTCFRVRGVGL